MAGDRSRRLLYQLDQQSILQRRIGLSVDVDVSAQVVRRAESLVEGANSLRYRPATSLALADEQIKQQEVGVDAVTLRQVHAEAVAAGLLAAHHRACLDHLG